MRIRDLLAMGFKNLWRRKARSFLTIFGVIIGATSIVLMVSIGLGQEKQMYQLYESFGDIRTITVFPANGGYIFEKEKEGEKSKVNKNLKLDDKAIDAFEKIEGVEMAVGFANSWGTLHSGRNVAHTQFTDVDLDKLAKMNVNLTKGKLPQKDSYEMLAGESLLTDFRNPRSRDYEPVEVDLMNEEVKLYLEGDYSEKGKKRPLRFTTSGLAHRYSEYGYGVIMDINVLKKIMKEELRKYPPSDAKERKKAQDKLKNFTYENIKVIAKSIDDVSTVQDIIKEMGYRSNSPIEYIKQSQKQLEQQKLRSWLWWLSTSSSNPWA